MGHTLGAKFKKWAVHYLVHKRFNKFFHNLWWWIVNDETDAIPIGLLLEPY